MTMKRYLLGLCLVIGMVATPMSAQLAPQPAVDPFTGAFTCSIPLLTVPGPHGMSYPIVLSYNSDISAEAEASWVGYGWSLEPPSVTRSRKGFPDDLDRRPMTYMERNELKRITVSMNANKEILSTNLSGGKDDFKLSLSLVPTFSYDNVNGADLKIAAGPSVSYALTEGLNVSLAPDKSGRISAGLSTSFGGANIGLGQLSYDPRARNRPVPGNIPLYKGTNIVSQAGVTLLADAAGATFSTLTIEGVTLSRPISGYLYTPESYDENKTDVIRDYIVERERTITIDHPAPLPMPMPAVDEFTVSGAGVSGRFRAHLPTPMDARPPRTESRIETYTGTGKLSFVQLGSGGGLGTTLDIPSIYSVSTGDYRSELSDLEREGKAWRKVIKPFFRYYGDGGGQLLYSSNNGLLPASMDGPGSMSYYPVNRGQRPATNKLVKYETVGDIRQQLTLNPPNVSDLTKYVIQGNGTAMSEKPPTMTRLPDEVIARFSVVDESGGEAVFGAPVYSIKEKSETFVTRGGGLEGETRNNDRITYRNQMPTSVDCEVGSSTELSTLYAVRWDATALLAPGYHDINNNGPDNDDIGGWVKFDYIRDKRSTRWRSPHTGFWLNRQAVETPKDDILTYSEGEKKEQTLKSVETATHIAYFYTSGNHQELTGTAFPADLGITYPARKDGFDPPKGDAAAKNDPDYSGAVNNAKYLARIDLYTKNALGRADKLVKRVHFVYDYSLAKGNPSSAKDGQGQRLGKLTLRRVWTEDRDIVETTIKPIDFYYEYPELSSGGGSPTSSVDRIAIGNAATSYPEVFASPELTPAWNSINENPNLDIQEIDAWGNQTGLKPWKDAAKKDQEIPRITPAQPWDGTVSLDAAPWRLKTIRMSSGMRIVPVYERRTYQYVQDKKAMVMAPLNPTLSGDISNSISANPAKNEYVIDLTQVGVAMSNDATAAEQYFTEFKNRFVDGGEPMLYRFAYRYRECEGSEDKRFNVRGYAVVRSAELMSGSASEPARLKIKLGEMKANESLVGKGYNSILEDHKSGPYASAAKYYKTKLRSFCYGRFLEPVDLLNGLMSIVSEFAFDSPLSIQYTYIPKTDYQRSSLRLPVFGAKTGGGARVSKIISISPPGTMGSGTESVTGSFYTYGSTVAGKEVESYGVATSEPSAMRDEWPILGVLPQYWARTRGEEVDIDDAAFAESSMGSGLLPGPSIGYSKIIVSSINTRANNPGHIVQEFYTAKDVPTFTLESSPVQILENKPNSPIMLPMFSLSKHRLAVAQSYLVKRSNVHGLPKSTSHYTENPGSSSAALITSTRTEYLLPGDNAYYFDKPERSLRSRSTLDVMDIIHERRSFAEYSFNRSLDLTLLIITSGAPPLTFPVFGLGFSNSRVDHITRTSVVTQIQTFNPLVKRTISFNNGRTDTSEIDAFDIRTGASALISRFDEYSASVNDGAIPAGNHRGRVTSVVVPAHTVYPEMGKAAPRYRLEFGNDMVVPYVGETIAQIDNTVGPPKLNIQRRSATSSTIDLSVDIDVDQRRSLFHASLKNNDIIAVYSLGGTLQAMCRVTSVDVVPTNDHVNATLAILSGSLSGNAQRRIMVVRPSEKNNIHAAAQQMVIYGWDAKKHKDHANELRYWSWLPEHYNDALRGFSGINLKYGATMRYESIFGTFDPGEAYQGLIDPYTGCILKPSSQNFDSQFWQTMWYERSTKTARWGFRRPIAALEQVASCPPATLALDYIPPICVYNIQASSSNPCYIATWHHLTWQSGILFSIDFGLRTLQEAPFDSWKRFHLGDRIAFHYGTLAPNPGEPTMGVMKLKKDMVSVADMACIPTDARTLSSGITVWNKYIPDPTSPWLTYWAPATSWIWETDAVFDAGGAAVAGRLNFAQSGTYATPTPLPSTYITDPLSSTNRNTTVVGTVIPRNGWFRGNLLNSLNRHGQPTKVHDVHGVELSTQYSDDGKLVKAVFSNTDMCSAWFDDCEPNSLHYLAYGSLDAHSGISSFKITTAMSTQRDIPAPYLGSNTTCESVFKFWIKPQDVNNRVRDNVTLNGSTLTANDSIACVNGWRLIEKRFASAPSQYSFSTTGPTFLVDDIMIHSVNATANGMVYDNEYRVRTSFGEDHFAVHTTYRPDGKPAAQRAETVSGQSSAVHGWVNIPSVERNVLSPFGGAYADAGLSSFSPLMMRNAVNEELDEVLGELPRVPASGIGAKGSLFDFNASADGVRSQSIIGGKGNPFVAPLLKNETKED